MLKHIDRDSGDLDYAPKHGAEPEQSKLSENPAAGSERLGRPGRSILSPPLAKRSSDLGLWFDLARRQAFVLLVAVLAGLLVGFMYIITTVPQYTATTELLIDSRKDKKDVSVSIAELTFDTGAIESQVEILKSDRIAQLVYANLKLADNREFMRVRKTLFSQGLGILRGAFALNRWFASPPKFELKNDVTLKRDTVSSLQNNLAVRRLGRSYVLALDYTAPDPTLAATIVNAFAEAYLSDQLDSKVEVSERIIGWMEAHLAQLKSDSLNSDLVVQKYKADHGLVTAGGKLVSDQQLSELTSQLMAAESETAKAEARVKRFGEIYRSERDVAKAREDSVKQSMAALAGDTAETNQKLVELRELQRVADTYSSLYQAFLQRYQEIVQHETAPVSEARVIAAASPPSIPSHPRRSLILALSLVIGSMAGIGIGVLRENLDRTFRTTSQVSEVLGLNLLGMLQDLGRPAKFTKPCIASMDANKITPQVFQQRYSIDYPLSPFTETLRLIKLAMDMSIHDCQPKVIGFVSALSGEGKTTVSKNFASFLARLGASTLLVDGDLRHCGLTVSLASHANEGILEAIREDRTLQDLLLLEPESGLFVLPAVITQRLHHPGEVLSSRGMRNLLTEARKDFDYVIVDLPPLAPVVDVPTAASIFDAFVLIVEWGRTPRSTVQSILASHKPLFDRCLGIVFNKVPDKVALYESHNSMAYKAYHTNEERKYYG
jgi:succinoglycan biosynthesis transport protein ExoP